MAYGLKACSCHPLMAIVIMFILLIFIINFIIISDKCLVLLLSFQLLSLLSWRKLFIQL